MKNLILLLLLTIAGQTITAQNIAMHLSAPVNFQDSTNLFLTTAVRYDSDNDGIMDFIVYYEYNARGLDIGISTDSDNDGIIDKETRKYRNNNGDEVLVESDTNADGIIDESTSYEYDENNQLIATNTDFNNDGIIDEIYTLSYNADNNLTWESIDYDGDGSANYNIYYFYDASGNLIENNEDDNADGFIDERSYYEYDVYGNNTVYRLSDDGDTIIDFVRYLTYNNDNQVILQTTDSNNDGTIDNTIAYTYVNGLLSRSSQDSDANGTIDRYSYYYYDANDNLYSTELDFDADGVIDFIDFSIFDANSNKLISSRDSDGDGIYERQIYYDYGLIKNCSTVTGMANKQYLIDIPYAGDWIISTCGSTTNFDTEIYIGTSPCDTDLGTNTNYCGNKAELEISVSGPQSIYLLVNGENNEIGNFELNVYDKNATGIREIVQLDLEIYPNPARENLRVKDLNLDGMTYIIYDAMGTKSLEGELDFSTGIDLHYLSTGMYFLRMEGDNTLFNANFIKE